MKIKIILFFILFIILLIFKSWFSFNSLSTGDWMYKFPQSILKFTVFPYAWNPNFGVGLGSSNVFLLALETYFAASVFILYKYLNIQWEIIEKLLWFFPFLLVSVLGSFFLFKKLFIKDNLLALISSLIFSTNTYILMVVGGGQMGISMAYAMFPIVFLCFLLILENSEKKNIIASIIAGVCFSIQLLFDLRIAYVSMVFLGIYYLIFSYLNGFLQTIKSSFLRFVIIPGIIISGLHFFWIFPFIILGENPLEKLGSAFSETGIVRFLSFARFQDTISLLHPNWPENIFGKVYFMRPEFLILPILAFFSLFFISKTKDQRTKSYILFFALIGLIGAFLAKGSNEPFGNLYIFAFDKIPGFMMFRDSTKWYGIVALSYSILIPYCIYLLSSFEIKKTKIRNLLIILFTVIWIFLLKESFTGNLKGTFIPKKVPIEYIQLTDFLSSKKDYFRTIWIPVFHQYSYYSNYHPIISANNFYSTDKINETVKKIEEDINILRKSSVKYVIVPSDIEGKIFLKDRKYSEDVYRKTVENLNKNQSLKITKNFGKIAVFEVSNPKDHFWTPSKNISLKYQYLSPVEYKIEVKNAKKGDMVVFSESYDGKWIATSELGIKNKELRINSTEFDNKFNSFVLPEDGNYDLRVYYTPQDYVNAGVVISGLSLILILGILIYLKKKKI